MDRELRDLVRAIRDGRIQDANRIREILGQARQALDRLSDRLSQCDDLVEAAERAFLLGWPSLAETGDAEAGV